MLLSLHVRDLALIAEEEVSFTDGLNILTGETGAGKSILIGSVNLALGAKADRAVIRDGAEYALVELLFAADHEAQLDRLRELSLPVEEDGTILIKRKILPSRSICTVNGETVTAHQLREIGSLLIDIYGQRENQTLLQRGRQLDILDDYAGEKAAALKQRVREHDRARRALEEEWNRGDMDGQARSRELELLDFEIHEIEAAAVKPGEEEELDRRCRRMASAGKISEKIGLAAELVDGDGGAAELIARVCRELREVSGKDEALEPVAEQIGEIDILLSDFTRTLMDYAEELSFDPSELEEAEERLNLIRRMSEKYGSSEDGFAAALAERQERFLALTDYEETRGQLRVRLDKERESYLQAARDLSGVRRAAAKEFAGRLRQALLELNFQQVMLNIEVESDESRGDGTGIDRTVFLISMNPGESPRPLDQIASGGELSRIMLGLKTVFAGRDEIHSFIFDEIDTGISGQTAWRVAEKLGRLSRDHQLLCITHLPQITAMADTHFRIRKDSEEGRTYTHIEELSGEESLGELGRLLGGAAVTEATLRNAAEMREMAQSVKRADS
ncbi:DNA repair protein RecN [Lachnoclostridium sp. Marseille-P6806]|uniref:DNA repair protein RecN n=1 Tax=Lachnoclostridium sp. Marseille-P6806 TaxID=2364793 RepID=UPI001031DA77|nr:DNA repair protein RecN [Lachnoclostridium sp. Marseille-P6806]